MEFDPKAVRPLLRKLFISLNLPFAELLKLLRSTLRFDESLWEVVERDRPVLLALYHGELLPLLLYGAFKPKLATLVSRHADGEIIARVVQRLGYRTLRGSTDEGRYKGGSKALRGIISLLRENYHIALTVDGPKGPCCRVKEGIIYAAWFTKRPIYPVRVRVKGIELPTWDRFKVPLPFARMEVKLGSPLWVEEKEKIEEYRQQLERSLEELLPEGNRFI